MAKVHVDFPLFGPAFNLEVPDSDIPDPLADWKIRVQFKEGYSWREVKVPGGLRPDLSEEDLLELAGGREYRLRLVWGRNVIPGTPRALDLRDQGEPHDPPGYSAADRRDAGNAVQSVFSDMAKQARADAQTMMLQTREDGRKLVDVVTALASGMGGGGGPALMALQTENGRLATRVHDLESECAKLQRELTGMSIRAHLAEMRVKESPAHGGPWRIFERVLEKLADKGGLDLVREVMGLPAGGLGSISVPLDELPPETQAVVESLLKRGTQGSG